MESSLFCFGALKHMFVFLLWLSTLNPSDCSYAEAILYNASPTTVKQYYVPYPHHHLMRYSKRDFQFREQKPVHFKRPPIAHDVFQIEPSDAIDKIKYSQPAYPELSAYLNMKVPSTTPNNRVIKVPAPHRNLNDIDEQSFASTEYSVKDTATFIRDHRNLDHESENGYLREAIVNSKYKISDDFDTNYSSDSPNMHNHEKNNFTDINDYLVLSSDAVLSYEVPTSNNTSTLQNHSIVRQNVERAIDNVLSLNYTEFNYSTLLPIVKTVLPGFSTESSIVFNTHVYSDSSNQTENNDAVSTVVYEHALEDGNSSSVLPSKEIDSDRLSSGTVAGIVISVLVCVTVLSSAVIYLLYRKYNGKCTSVVEGKFNSDNCGYLDDSLRSSIYLNNHIELPKESSEEMTSLDNDSFLNSLETMTIQNYWADNSKNTKV
ncbi:uncharacterized protein LOC129218536 isoform X1 [Uloborus diversus]|uniref:uncharacterized protein LOC129218536 isoform X1 n=1 Tax=Uloborus diversus TaxID=327109 RepID=UPI0024096578|nr:uncharacterized protein LOC129218536 isoform X1 [Uloborus diversus]